MIFQPHHNFSQSLRNIGLRNSKQVTRFFLGHFHHRLFLPDSWRRQIISFARSNVISLIPIVRKYNLTPHSPSDDIKYLHSVPRISEVRFHPDHIQHSSNIPPASFIISAAQIRQESHFRYTPGHKSWFDPSFPGLNVLIPLINPSFDGSQILTQIPVFSNFVQIYLNTDCIRSL